MVRLFLLESEHFDYKVVARLSNNLDGNVELKLGFYEREGDAFSRHVAAQYISTYSNIGELYSVMNGGATHNGRPLFKDAFYSHIRSAFDHSFSDELYDDSLANSLWNAFSDTMKERIKAELEDFIANPLTLRRNDDLSSHSEDLGPAAQR